MPLQTLLALLIVAAAVAYIARRLWYTVKGYRTGSGESAGGCNCEPGAARPRRDER